MSQKLITRLRPADLQEVQAQTAADAAISDVITSLQSNISTEEAPLNTLCPTCTVEGVAYGYLPFTFENKQFHSLCPTCRGYLLINTEDGGETPPVNPFEEPLVVTRLLPSDLKEALAGFSESTTLDLMVTSLQGNLPVGGNPLDFDCPTCKDEEDVSTGWVTIDDNKTICYTCGGYQKTVYEIPTPVIEPPDPSIIPTFVWPPVLT